MTPEDRFWARVDVGHPLGCWQWTGSVNRLGYGQHRGGVSVGTSVAHRIAYILLVGEIPDGRQLDHLCRNHGCVNPDHLEPVTRRENILRGYGPIAKQARQTRCRRGHRLPAAAAGKKRTCRPCEAEKRRRLRAAAADRLHEREHGTESTYSNYGCRCGRCKAAASAAWRARHLRKKQAMSA